MCCSERPEGLGLAGFGLEGGFGGTGMPKGCNVSIALYNVLPEPI